MFFFFTDGNQVMPQTKCRRTYCSDRIKITESVAYHFLCQESLSADGVSGFMEGECI